MPAITSLLPNDLLAVLERLRVRSTRKLTDRGRGDHLAGRGGTSTDFADYRDYAAGDDLRGVDWNIFARLQRPYLKQFRMEEERHLVLLVDTSTSMHFAGKLDRAKELAAAFAVMGRYGGDRVSVWAPAVVSQATRGRAGMRRCLDAIAGIAPAGVAAGGALPVEAAIDALLARHRGRGVCVVISDCLSDGDLKRGLNRLFASGLEPCVVQILSPWEADPDLAGDLRLVDCETTATLDISTAGDLLALYHEYRARHQQQLADWCASRQGRFLSVTAAADIRAIVDQLRRKGWVA